MLHRTSIVFYIVGSSGLRVVPMKICSPEEIESFLRRTMDIGKSYLILKWLSWIIILLLYTTLKSIKYQKLSIISTIFIFYVSPRQNISKLFYNWSNLSRIFSHSNLLTYKSVICLYTIDFIIYLLYIIKLIVLPPIDYCVGMGGYHKYLRGSVMDILLSKINLPIIFAI